MLDEVNAFALLKTAEESTDQAVDMAAVRAIVGLGVHPVTWRKIGPTIVELLDVAPGTAERAECLELLAALPVASALRRLSGIAGDPADPDRDTAAEWLAEPGSGPLTAERIGLLVEELSADPVGPAVKELAVIPIENYAIRADLFLPAHDSGDVETRIWAAIAAARLGQLSWLDEIVEDLDGGDVPRFMSDNPSASYDTLASARPIPDLMRAHLVGRENPELGSPARLFIWALTGVRDATGRTPEEAAASEAVQPTRASWVQRFAARRTARRLLAADRAHDWDVVASLDIGSLAALPPQAAGALVAELCASANGEGDRAQATVGNRILDVIGRIDTSQLPVDRILSSYMTAAEPRMDTGLLAFVLASGDIADVVQTFDERLQTADPRVRTDLTNLLDTTVMSAIAPVPPYRGAGTLFGITPRWNRPTEIIDDLQWQSEAVPPTAVERPSAPLYSRIDCPDAVVVEEPFDCLIGVSPRRDPRMVSAGALKVTGAAPSLEVFITVDPQSLRLDGEPKRRLAHEVADPTLSVTVRLTALDRDGLTPDRRIVVHYFQDGQLVGIAFRRLHAVHSEAELRTAFPSQTRERDLLDLAPLLAVQDAPDLVLAVYRADEADRDRFVWAAYPSEAGVAVPDTKRANVIGEDSRDFAMQARRRIGSTKTAQAQYDSNVGFGTDIADAIPEGIREVVRQVASQPNRSSAAAVLLLCEEPHIPWELAVLEPALATAFGGSSPFLGAHIAISRWPLSEHRHYPRPLTAVEVRRQAVLTARYEGVPRWPRLECAEGEAEAMANDWPPVAMVRPLRSEVVSCLKGEPPVDLLHVALHGQFDQQGLEDGLVLLDVDDKGHTVAEFLTAQQVRGLRPLKTQPFVFLNACQVGAGDEVLGNYAGMAESILRAGARAVIAPLWSIDDDVAAAVAKEFYAAAYSEDPPPVAEILRRIRAKYTATAIGTSGVTPTLIAYQLFGHPRLKLHRISDPS